MKISICMMVKNEEKNLTRCLEKLKPLIESGLAELIIVDTGSTDRSIDISKEYTEKVYFHQWNKNFSEMRNISISYAKGEWIFIIDADERLDDVEKLITLMNSSEIKKYNTVILKVKNLYNVIDESKYNLITSPRIFKNDGKFRYEGAVHNQPIFKGPNLSVDINLTHFGYIATDKVLMEIKYNRTTELLKSELAKEPENLYYIYQLGVSYDMHGDHKEALDEFRKAYSILETRTLKEKKIYAYIYASYTRIAYTNNQIKETLKIAKEGLDLEKDYVDLYYLLGICEKQLKNNEASFKYFIKYIDLFNRYNKLEISKDMTTTMYHMDDKSKSIAHFEIYQYYFNNEKYTEAYKEYKKITIIEQKIYSSINILVQLEKYKELRTVYLGLHAQTDKDSFIYTLEAKLKKLKEKSNVQLYKEFSLNQDIYGKLNKLRLTNDMEDRLNFAKLLIEEIDFNNAPLIYSEIFMYVKMDIKLITKIFRKIEVCNLRNIVKQLIEEKEFLEIFEDYILQNNIDILEIEDLKVSICIATILMIINIEENNELNEKYVDIFKSYIKSGVYFVSQLYQVKNAEEIYRCINNEEDRFFILMYIIDKFIEVNDKKSAVNYMIEAVNLNKALAKYIDIYKNELFNLKEKNQIEQEKQQFENYKLKVKENINSLINVGNLEEAKELIKGYEEIVKQDAEIYSMNAVIYIMEGRIDDAEIILKNGLEIHPKNKDLLYNFSYVMSLKNNNTKAVELYSRAKLFNTDSNVKVRDIISNFNPSEKNRLRVIHGTIEIANQMHTMAEGLKKIGVDAKTLNYYPNYLGYKSDYNLDINSFKDSNEANIETKKLASKVISENDIFHFHFGTSLTLDYSDLPLLKELGKKVVMQYWGSDVRLYSKAIKLNPYIKVKDMNEEGIKRKLELISKFIPDCIVDYELAEYAKDYHSNVHYTTVAIDLSKYKFIKETHNKKILIVHAPTSPEFKGTSYILKAIEELKAKYDFDFKLVQGMSHDEATKIYQQADLIIDQILTGGYGVFAVESMAMGKPVISWISDFMKEKYPEELPIISANPDNVKEKIEYAIKNKDMLKEIGIRSRMYAEKYHDMNKISKNMLEIYKKI